MLKRCPECGAEQVRPGTAEIQREVGGVTFKAKVPVQRCRACKEWFVDAETGARFDLAVALGVVGQGLGSPDAFKYMRKAVGLRAAELAELLGVTPETVSRWENGKVPVERRALALLQAIVTERGEGRTATVDRLRGMSESHRPRRRTVRVALGINPSGQ